MYLDGVLIATTDTLDTPDPVTYPLNIGATGAGANYPWSGAIDQVKIYTTSLTPFAILGTYLEGAPDLTEAVAERTLGALDFQLVASDTDPYGLQYREIYDPTITEREPHGFTGQEKEPDFGLYYYNGRWYFPDGGGFIQVDPERQYWNPYSYVGNNPIVKVDPTGRHDGFVVEVMDLVQPVDPSSNARVAKLQVSAGAGFTKQIAGKGYQGVVVEFSNGEISNFGFFVGGEAAIALDEVKIAPINVKISKGKVEFEYDPGTGIAAEFSIEDGVIQDGAESGLESTLFFFDFKHQEIDSTTFKGVATTKPGVNAKYKGEFTLSFRGAYNAGANALNGFWTWLKTAGGVFESKKIE